MASVTQTDCVAILNETPPTDSLQVELNPNKGTNHIRQALGRFVTTYQAPALVASVTSYLDAPSGGNPGGSYTGGAFIAMCIKVSAKVTLSLTKMDDTVVSLDVNSMHFTDMKCKAWTITNVSTDSVRIDVSYAN